MYRVICVVTQECPPVMHDEDTMIACAALSSGEPTPHSVENSVGSIHEPIGFLCGCQIDFEGVMTILHIFVYFNLAFEY